MMNKLLFTSLCMSSSILGTYNGDAQSQTDLSVQKPNVLFVFVDDLTFDGLNTLGNKEIISPNMDKLIKSGVSFNNTYNMGGWHGAISMASRAQLFTGLYLWNTHHAEKNRYKEVSANGQVWTSVMKEAGYKTYHSGKWHVPTLPANKIFDEAESIRPGMPGTVKSSYNRPLSVGDTAWIPWDTSIGGFWAGEGNVHWSEVLANLTIDYLNENKNSKEPLFISCAFNAPHDPRQAPKEYVDMYDLDKIKLPKSYLSIHPYLNEMGCPKSLRDEKLAPYPRTAYSIKKHIQEYYAIITHMDAQIGRIFEALEKNGMLENTLIVFSADNGLALGKHGLVGKQSMYDHSMKVPLVFAGCGLPEGESRDQLVYLQDLVPTIYDLIGVETPEGVEYVSQLDIIKNKKVDAKRDCVYGAYMNLQRMVRNDRYKLFFIPKAKQVYLFDLKKDPEEVNNLYGQKKYDKIVKELASRYLSLAEESGDRFNLSAIYPEIFEN